MKLLRSLILPLTLLLGFLSPIRPGLAAGAPDPGQICISVGKLLEQGHYSRHKLDDEISRRLLQNYLEALDYSKLFFTQADIDRFTQKDGTGLDDDILLGTPDPAVAIFDTYKKRVEDRVAKIKHLIATEKFAFDSDRTVLLNRQKAPWPKDEAEADQLWRDRIEGEMLQEKLGQTAKKTGVHPAPASSGTTAVSGTGAQPMPDTPEKIVAHRYDQLVRNLHEQNHQDAIDIFLTCLAQTYDPHSEYMSKTETDNFAINMKLSLVGIGAVLHSEDGYAKIMELVIGGPAQKDGRLKVGDKVTAVAQGSNEFVDAIDMKLDKVVSMIRGPKNTKVRLQVIPAHAADPSARKIIEIVRDEVKLKDAAAKAEIIERPDAHGGAQRLGWITLPSFYADMEHADSKGAKSTTRDVSMLLNRLKQENIGGLIIDLRRNGGGSLDEALRLTNLFVKRGPVVQVKDGNGDIKVLRDRDANVAYDGPLIVLINRLSASASEIFAAALQDYGRALIVGDHNTFGKGTVQMLLDVGDIGHVISFGGNNDKEAGSLKLTIQKFYRIAGGSTQLHGVASDIVLPSLYDHEDIGESALKGPLPYDEVEPAEFEKVTDHPLFADQLRERSVARVAADPEFKYIIEDLAKLKAKIADNRISLNEQVRRDEIAKEKARKESRIAERAKRQVAEPTVYAVTLENVDQPKLELAKNDLTKPDPNDPRAIEEKWLDPAKGVPSKHHEGRSSKAGTKGKKSEHAAQKESAKPEKKTDNTAASSEADSATGDDADAEGDEDLDAPENGKGPRLDPVRTETLNILADLVDLSRTQKTASVQK